MFNLFLIELAFYTKSQTTRNSNCRWNAAERGGTLWELCILRSSTALKVDTPDCKTLFHVTAMSVYQRKPTMDHMAYLTEAQHLDTTTYHHYRWHGCCAWIECSQKSHCNCQDLSAFFIRTIDNKSFGYCEAYLIFDDYRTVRWKIIQDN